MRFNQLLYEHYGAGDQSQRRVMARQNGRIRQSNKFPILRRPVEAVPRYLTTLFASASVRFRRKGNTT